MGGRPDPRGGDARAAPEAAALSRAPARLAGIVAIAAAAAGCVAEPDSADEQLDRRGAAIIGGIPAIGDPAVVGLRMCLDGSCSSCTGTLVSRRSVLTAAHCLDANVAAGEPGGVSVYFGTDTSEPGTWIDADELQIHRYYDIETLDYDIGMIHLAEDAPALVEPVALNADPLGEDDVGATVRLVGFGETAFGAGDFGVKREVETTLNIVSPEHFFVGDEQRNTCKGDSGGPTFLDRGGGEQQIGVTSRSRACAPNSVKMRVDVFLGDLVWPFVDRFEGPCAADGTCIEACPRSPDPDCDPCLQDGTCEPSCIAPDWDCPIGVRAGGACTSADECEWGYCLEAADDPRLRFCSRPCAADAPCPPDMVCADRGGEPRCVWEAPSPGALGAACSLPDDCRSELCEDGVCVETCAEVAGGACPEPYACRPSPVSGDEVCGPPRGGGGCRAAGGGGVGALLVALLSIVAVRRRREHSLWRASGRR